MDKITRLSDFKSKLEEYVYQCGDCKGQAFYLLSDHTIECCECGKEMSNIFNVDTRPKDDG